MDAKVRDRLSTNFLEERLSDRTMAERRNLLVAAAFGIVVHVYEVNPPDPWLGLKVENGGNELLQGGLAVATLYLMFMFTTYLWDDYLRWRIAKSFIDLGHIFPAMQQLNIAMLAVRQAVQAVNPGRDLHSTIQGFPEFEVLETAMSQVHNMPDIQAASGTFKDRPRLIFVQRFRLFVLDVGVPMVLGLLAIWLLAPSAQLFLTRAVSASRQSI